MREEKVFMDWCYEIDMEEWSQQIAEEAQRVHCAQKYDWNIISERVVEWQL